MNWNFSATDPERRLPGCGRALTSVYELVGVKDDSGATNASNSVAPADGIDGEEVLTRDQRPAGDHGSSAEMVTVPEN